MDGMVVLIEIDTLYIASPVKALGLVAERWEGL